MSWGPPPLALGIAAVGAIGAALFAVVLAVNSDGPGAVLLGLLALVLAAAAAHGAVVRPRLRADAQVVTARTLTRTHTAPWSDVTMRVQVTQRLGRDSRTLEVDFPSDSVDVPQLVVLGRLELGEDPDDVMAALSRLRGF